MQGQIRKIEKINYVEAKNEIQLRKLQEIPQSQFFHSQILFS